MRGKAEPERLRQLSGGITPAYAGKSSGSTLMARLVRDHPRVCREKGITLIPLLSGLGSPPRVRGKAGLAGLDSGDEGIAPACAGKKP